MGLLGFCWGDHMEWDGIRSFLLINLLGRTCMPYPDNIYERVVIFRKIMHWLSVARPVITDPSLGKVSTIKFPLDSCGLVF